MKRRSCPGNERRRQKPKTKPHFLQRAAPNASAPANEQLSYSTLMSLNTGFYYYTYCNYNGQRHTIDLSEELQLHTFRMAQKYGVQYELVMAVMGVEPAGTRMTAATAPSTALGRSTSHSLKSLKA